MKISLDQVDEVISRTGTTYENAKKALEKAGGDVLEAIIIVEEKVESTFESSNKLDKLGQDFIDGLKELVNKGSVTKIVMMKDDRVIINIPVTAGAIGALFFTSAAVTGIIVGLATGCRLDIVKEDGEVIDVYEITEDTLNGLKEKINDCKDKVSDITTKKEDKKEDKREDNVINLKITKNDTDDTNKED